MSLNSDTITITHAELAVIIANAVGAALAERGVHSAPLGLSAPAGIVTVRRHKASRVTSQRPQSVRVTSQRLKRHM